MPRDKISVYLDPHVWADLQIVAKHQRRTMTAVIEGYIDRCMPDELEKARHALAARSTPDARGKPDTNVSTASNS